MGDTAWGDDMNYEEWLKSVPMEITGDPLWTVEAYRLALFTAELGWHDVTKLMKDKRTMELSDQLYRALGSIGANISEGYSRGGGRDRAHFYEYALGSARESRGWYCNGRHVLGETVAEHRIHLLSPDRSPALREWSPTSAVRLSMKMVPPIVPIPKWRTKLPRTQQTSAPRPFRATPHCLDHASRITQPASGIPHPASRRGDGRRRVIGYGTWWSGCWLTANP